MARKKYISPEFFLIFIDDKDIVCESPYESADQTESNEDFDDWFN